MVQQVIGLLFGIILGRLLAPSDYGMMAIISVFSLVALALQDSGFKVALANEKAPTHAGYNAVFWFNILMGIALYAALFLSAPPHRAVVQHAAGGAAVALLALAPLGARYHLRPCAQDVPLLVQDTGVHRHHTHQQQRAQHTAGPLFLHGRRRQLQPGLPVELQVLLAHTEHGGAGGAACAACACATAPPCYPPPARARGWRGAIRGFFYPFIFAWHCSQFDME